MKWRAPSERTQGILLAPIAVTAVVIASPVLVPLIALVWLSSKWPRMSQDWHRWFAWRPVPLKHWSEHIGKRGGWAWLETVERRAMPYDWPTEYRALPAAPATDEGNK